MNVLLKKFQQDGQIWIVLVFWELVFRVPTLKLIIKIKTLLYENGYTVKGVQKLLKEKKHILNNENINNNDEGIKEKLKNILQDLDKIIKKL